MMPICFETPTKVRGKEKGRAVRPVRVVLRERRADRTPLPTPIEVFRFLVAQGEPAAFSIPVKDSALEVVPLVRIAATQLEEKRLAAPGAVTARFMAAYRELVMSETRPG